MELFDDAWQALGIMMELDAALKSRDPHAYLTGVPVHQDGT